VNSNKGKESIASSEKNYDFETSEAVSELKR